MNTTENQNATSGVTAAGVVSSPSLGSVFEISENDETNDTYYTMGFFPSLESAIAAVDEDGIGFCVNAQESQDFACVEIHEHKLGRIAMRGKPVWSRRWTHEWNEDGTTRWQVVPNT